ncbi:ABC transporter permease [Reticulibacter mediterranei]|uniref:ABC transporter permease n=1 Tax=Reticulibacter mediterranei TaxID=2778369 RepID=A0A8J3J289_9CHLR|nr:ABC transporter permease [Reticulibacter mediterranei]GHP00981.1 ABC transporter permease [Reticulibacter mediterranei]
MRTTTLPDTQAKPEQSNQRLSLTRRQGERRNLRSPLFINVVRLALLVVFLIVWQFLSGRFIDPLFISSPLAVFTQTVAWIMDGTLWMHTEITLQETLLGLFFGIISGIAAGFLLGLQPLLAEACDPFIASIYSIPKIALAPLFILWFGIDIQMKIVLASVTVFFLIFFNTLAGVRNADQHLIDAVRLMGGRYRDVLLKVIVPSATGSMLTGVHIAIPYALIGAVVAELIASNRGLGYLIDASATSFNTAGVFVALLVLSIIGGILNALVNSIDRMTSRWKTEISIGRKLIP